MATGNRRLINSFRPSLPDGVTLEDHGHQLRLTADVDVDGWATGFFAHPAHGVSFSVDELVDGCRFLGFAFGQFALPVVGAADEPFGWNPADNVNSPPAVVPLVIGAPDGTVCLLAPLDSWHEQIFSVDQTDDGIVSFRWGWHGDLEHIAAGTTTTLGVYEGTSVTAVFDRWGADIRAASAHRFEPTGVRQFDEVTTHLSYWTDNGAAYWYRTEPGKDMARTVADKLVELDALGITVESVELDSWFYSHEISRPVIEIGGSAEAAAEQATVPPTGMLTWDPRPDVLPEGVDGMAARIGPGKPLILHARHISPESPYVKSSDDPETDWWVELTAQPTDPAFFGRWMSDAASWGARWVEQDWMIMNWFGNRPLRAEPGRAMDWLRGLNDAAMANDINLIWCMSTPGDLMAAVELPRVVAARTCDDYRYAADPARLWRWYLTVNRLASAIGLPTFKDCFFTATDPGPDGLNGDPHAEFESLLAALSAGPVGIGDRLGCTDPAIVARLCRPDGRLVQPDRPLALADQSFFDSLAGPPDRDSQDGGQDGEQAGPGLTWAETETRRADDRWRYVAAVHTAEDATPITDRFDLDGRYLVYDWRTATAAPADHIDAELAHRGWGYWVCCPIEADPDTADDPTVETVETVEAATIGDPAFYATMGPAAQQLGKPVRRWRSDRGLFDDPTG